jgi:hypothetical protein
MPPRGASVAIVQDTDIPSTIRIVTGKSNPGDDFGRPAPLGSRPRTFPLNKTRTSERIEVSLLAFVVVGRVIRISGLVRLHRPDLRIVRAPDLVVPPVDGPPLVAIGTHVLPNGDLSWVAWDFARPQAVLVTYPGRVDRLDLAYRSGGRLELIAPGPWVFDFRIPCRRMVWGAKEPAVSRRGRLDA